MLQKSFASYPMKELIELRYIIICMHANYLLSVTEQTLQSNQFPWSTLCQRRGQFDDNEEEEETNAEISKDRFAEFVIIIITPQSNLSIS